MKCASRPQRVCGVYGRKKQNCLGEGEPITTSLPTSIELPDIDPKWNLYAAWFPGSTIVHAKSDADHYNYAVCGIGGHMEKTDGPINCRHCIRELIRDEKLKAKGEI